MIEGAGVVGRINEGERGRRNKNVFFLHAPEDSSFLTLFYLFLQTKKSQNIFFDSIQPQIIATKYRFATMNAQGFNLQVRNTSFSFPFLF